MRLTLHSTNRFRRTSPLRLLTRTLSLRSQNPSRPTILPQSFRHQVDEIVLSALIDIEGSAIDGTEHRTPNTPLRFIITSQPLRGTVMMITRQPSQTGGNPRKLSIRLAR